MADGHKYISNYDLKKSYLFIYARSQKPSIDKGQYINILIPVPKSPLVVCGAFVSCVMKGYIKSLVFKFPGMELSSKANTELHGCF